MSTVTTIPALAKSSALTELVRRGEFTPGQRELLARLLDEITSSARVAVQVAERTQTGRDGRRPSRALPGHGSAHWARLLDAVSPVAAQ